MNEFQLPQEIQTKILISYINNARKCQSIYISENTIIYQKFNIFICTTYLVY